MQVKLISSIIVFFSLVLVGCSKKHQPQASTATVETKTEAEKASAATAARKKAVNRAIGIPKVITVDDRAAKKSVDGRLYYDLEGRRYWRNYNDGKYYLFNKKMYNDPAFKPH